MIQSLILSFLGDGMSSKSPISSFSSEGNVATEELEAVEPDSEDTCRDGTNDISREAKLAIAEQKEKDTSANAFFLDRRAPAIKEGPGLIVLYSFGRSTAVLHSHGFVM